MKVHKVVKHLKVPANKQPKGPKIAYLRREPTRNKQFVVQVYKGNSKVKEKDFINKTAALEWLDLNDKDAELKDLTSDTRVRSTEIKTS